MRVGHMLQHRYGEYQVCFRKAGPGLIEVHPSPFYLRGIQGLWPVVKIYRNTPATGIMREHQLTHHTLSCPYIDPGK